jgi:hypothetical protein
MKYVTRNIYDIGDEKQFHHKVLEYEKYLQSVINKITPSARKFCEDKNRNKIDLHDNCVSSINVNLLDRTISIHFNARGHVLKCLNYSKIDSFSFVYQEGFEDLAIKDLSTAWIYDEMYMHANKNFFTHEIMTTMIDISISAHYIEWS